MGDLYLVGLSGAAVLLLLLLVAGYAYSEGYRRGCGDVPFNRRKF